MNWFHVLTLAGWLGVVLAASTLRGRPFAIRAGILLGIYSLLALAMVPRSPVLRLAFAAFDVTVYVNFIALARPRLRPLAYRLLVSWPAAFFSAGTLLSLPWALPIAFGFHPWAPWIPYALGAVGVLQSLTTREEEIDLVVGNAEGNDANVRVLPHPRGKARVERPLRLVQITDPHLGPFMSVARLRRIAARAVAKAPDVILLTGDFLTMESQRDVDAFTRALEPLRTMPGKVFACLGNHDHEAPDTVARGLAANGVTLLVDDERTIETDAGPVQIVGADFTWREREAHLARVCREHPRKPGVLRVILLHDPGAFRHLPPGEGDLVLSGHTHGGQVGLLSLGLSWTFLRLFGLKLPDHGFWSRGTDRLYVHRGTGHYGFPLRLGVPSEESVVRVHRTASVVASDIERKRCSTNTPRRASRWKADGRSTWVRPRSSSAEC
jgi:predicted MPP superfamily phosphohydrolase